MATNVRSRESIEQAPLAKTDSAPPVKRRKGKKNPFARKRKARKPESQSEVDFIDLVSDEEEKPQHASARGNVEANSAHADDGSRTSQPSLAHDR